MRYIKTYERRETYEVGDYIWLDDVLECGEIVLITNIGQTQSRDCLCRYYYKDELNMLWLMEIEIKRKATPEEIDKYKMLKSSVLYNL